MTLIRAGHYFWDGGAIYGVVPKVLWQRQTPADELNRVPLAFNCYLIETGRHTVLIETGGGHLFDARAKERMNLPDLTPLPDLLRSFRVDMVINTHLHWDHCSGNMRDGKPAFPHAQYITGALEYAYAHERNSRDAVSYIDANYDPLVAAGQMRLTDGVEEIIPGITVEPAPGHNAGLLIVKAQSEGKTFCMLSDLIPTAQHLKPTWIAAFDLDPLTAIRTKERILSEAVESNWWCGFGHDMHHAFVTVNQDLSIQDTHS